MNSCKVIQEQAKATKSTRSTSRGIVAGRVQFQVAKRRLSKDQELNDLLASAVLEVLKQKKLANTTTIHGSVLGGDLEKLNFENLITKE